ncbi:hypothetical protein B0H17DRAFT_1337287 [Mycena rosella]|uniref:Mid2 domain-containing protein n=1 Tax=Mycena rosella TaxID=1033263 RepID=A0AAD7CRV9_MYCRO|nr:hypothetical protein B0H17DRAFT_1337287 [Mycena rosella]
MFYAIYVLAILCRTVLSLKIHTPGNGTVPANTTVNVSWSRQRQNDPPAVLMVIKNGMSGEQAPVPGGPLNTSSPGSSVPITFSDVGTFQLVAVNPVNNGKVYAMSKTFNVVSNNAAAGNVSSKAPGDDALSLPSPPPLPPTPTPTPNGSAETASSLSVPISSSTSLAATSGISSTQMKPYIIGGVIGVVVVLFILAGALIFVLFRRRKAREERRTTFHRSRMVKSLPPPTFAMPRDAELDSPIVDNDSRYRSGPRYLQDVPPQLSGPYPFSRTV